MSRPRQDSMVEGDQPKGHAMVRYRLEHGELVPHIDGQWTHVSYCGVKTWALDPPDKFKADSGHPQYKADHR